MREYPTTSAAMIAASRRWFAAAAIPPPRQTFALQVTTAVSTSHVPSQSEQKLSIKTAPWCRTQDIRIKARPLVG
jgi:hypothetical protein